MVGEGAGGRRILGLYKREGASVNLADKIVMRPVGAVSRPGHQPPSTSTARPADPLPCSLASLAGRCPDANTRIPTDRAHRLGLSPPQVDPDRKRCGRRLWQPADEEARLRHSLNRYPTVYFHNKRPRRSRDIARLVKAGQGAKVADGRGDDGTKLNPPGSGTQGCGAAARPGPALDGCSRYKNQCPRCRPPATCRRD